MQTFIRIGFTGTQQGMSKEQKEFLEYILSETAKVYKYGEFHHGDCTGADSEAHDIAEKYLKCVIHPPDIMAKRAFKKAEDIRKTKPYLDRNKDIVNETEQLIATPKEFEERLRSGTWSTIRYARKLKKRITIIYPNGAWII